MYKHKLFLFFAIIAIFHACGSSTEEEDCICPQGIETVCAISEEGELLEFANKCKALCEGFFLEQLIECPDTSSNYNDDFAEVVSVTTSKNAGSYSFSVGVLSPDAGCDQYANWWEVITNDGALLYRRILSHSHTPPRFSQPFIRSGGSLNITETQILIVRAHMNTSGYGNRVYRGSIQNGFEPKEIDKDFAKDLENAKPQPGTCPF